MFTIVELFYGTWGRKERKEKDRPSMISQNIISGYNDTY
jgi:hypothetical protein